MKAGLAIYATYDRCLAVVGALKAFSDHYIKLYAISAAGDAAYVSSMYTAGYTPEEINLILPEILNANTSDRHKIICDTLAKKGILTLRDFPMCTVLNCADLDSGVPVSFISHKGDLISALDHLVIDEALAGDAVCAAAGPPPYYSCGMRLISSGVYGGLHAGLLRQWGCDKVFAIYAPGSVEEKSLSKRIVDMAADRWSRMHLESAKAKIILNCENVQKEKLFDFGYEETKSKLWDIYGAYFKEDG